jgi:hypothetical protein
MEPGRIFYLNLKNKGPIYENLFKYWTRYSYFWRYSDPKLAFCAEIQGLKYTQNLS